MTKLTIENVEEIKKGYITAFFDAEGSVGIRKDYTLAVVINQAYKPVLEKINREFKATSGVTVHSKEGYDKRGVHRKGAWKWRLYSDDAITFLEYVRTYSIEKRSQIELGLKYQKTKCLSERIQLSQLETQKREWFKNEIYRLKHETPTEQEIQNYDNEIKKQSIPKDIRDGKQTVLSISKDKLCADIDEIYKIYGIDTTNSEQTIIDQNIPKMTNYIEMGYFAGFTDGEGYIGICKTEGKFYELHVTISNTNFDMLKMYETKFGGKIRHVQKGAEHHKEKYHWDINNHEALPFLKYIQSFTIVKRKQIDLAIEFQEWHDHIRSVKTLEQLKKAEWYYNTIMDMKKETGEEILDDEQIQENQKPNPLEKFMNMI